jgi:hypothetical protein
VELSPSPRDVKEAQLRHWNSVADGWAHWYGWTARNFGLLTPWLREATGRRSGASIWMSAAGLGIPRLPRLRPCVPVARSRLHWDR